MKAYMFELPQVIKYNGYDRAYDFKYLVLREYQNGGTHVSLLEDKDALYSSDDWGLSVWLDVLLSYHPEVNPEVMFFVDHNLFHLDGLLDAVKAQSYFKEHSVKRQSGFVLFESMLLDTTQLKRVELPEDMS